MTFILGIMESVYVMTGKTVYKDMTKFWGKLFGINFAMGVTTGLTLEFQFGTNWAYYSHYVGDIFGPLLASEGWMAFFLESTFVGLFFFGWDKLSKVQHLIVTWLLAVGTSLSALWILIANGWMQHPVGAEFNYETLRMELTSFAEVILNPVAQVKFVHTVAAGYVTGSMFVLGISSWYLLAKRDIGFARRSFQSRLHSGWRLFYRSLSWVMKAAIPRAKPKKPSWRLLRPNGRPNRRRPVLPCLACPTRRNSVPTMPLKYLIY